MHEVFLTRGNVQRARFDIQMQIYVSCNVVLVHHWCHETAQFEAEAKEKCMRQILEYHDISEVLNWLNTVDSSKVEEVIRLVESL